MELNHPKILAAMKLKQNLKCILQEKGLTASALSRMSGVPKQNVSDWLSGTHPRNLGQLKKVAEVLDLSIDELCFGKSEPSELKAHTHIVDDLIGEQWISGLFEVKLRRIKK